MINPVALRPIFVEVMPDFSEVKQGEIWISSKHRSINLRCPCGCGELTILSITPSRWHLYFDGESVSLEGPTGGSVWADSGCGSHYFIRKSNVVWAGGIDPSLSAKYAETERVRMNEMSRGTSQSQEEVDQGWFRSGLDKIGLFLKRLSSTTVAD